MTSRTLPRPRHARKPRAIRKSWIRGSDIPRRPKDIWPSAEAMLRDLFPRSFAGEAASRGS